MDGLNHPHNVSGMEAGGTMAPPPSTMSGPMNMHRKIMMRMTFFWGNNVEVLFTGWPGTNTRMYTLALAFVFAMCFVVEGLSHCRLLKPRPNRNVVAGLAQMLMHAVRMGLAYMAMLAVMSFNSRVFLATVAGYASGFLVFCSSVFRKAETRDVFEKSADLPPMSC